MSSSLSRRPGSLVILAFLVSSVVIVPAAWPQARDETSANAHTASSTRLLAKPVTCVALHKDQVCFQKVTLSWSALPPGDYCLYVDDLKRPLTCWFHDSLRQFTHQYQSADAMHYELREGSSDDAMAEVIVNTSWVYRTGRRSSSGWRLF